MLHGNRTETKISAKYVEKHKKLNVTLPTKSGFCAVYCDQNSLRDKYKINGTDLS